MSSFLTIFKDVEWMTKHYDKIRENQTSSHYNKNSYLHI